MEEETNEWKTFWRIIQAQLKAPFTHVKKKKNSNKLECMKDNSILENHFGFSYGGKLFLEFLNPSFKGFSLLKETAQGFLGSAWIISSTLFCLQ